MLFGRGAHTHTHSHSLDYAAKWFFIWKGLADTTQLVKGQHEWTELQGEISLSAAGKRCFGKRSLAFEKRRRCLLAGLRWRSSAFPRTLRKACRWLVPSTQAPGRSYPRPKVSRDKNLPTRYMPVQQKKVILEVFYSGFKELPWFLTLHITAC